MAGFCYPPASNSARGLTDRLCSAKERPEKGSHFGGADGQLHPYAIDRAARSARGELLLDYGDQRIDVLAQSLIHEHHDRDGGWNQRLLGPGLRFVPLVQLHDIRLISFKTPLFLNHPILSNMC
jgi:hypothetical protein